ncbi:MAG: hypothetical protein QG567_1764 [Campylobacterota bacterium]|nr:hypothetical protein [Campylobacterota bacterium]MDQ1340606.1 hypothetical protein [Campylobacterota bacterium]
MQNIKLTPLLEKKLAEVEKMGICEAETFLAMIVSSELTDPVKHYAGELTKSRIRVLNREEAMLDHMSEPVTLD